MSRAWLLLPLAALCGCARQETPPDPTMELRTAETRWASAAQSKDVERFLSNYGEKASLMAPNAPSAEGVAAIRPVIEQMFREGALKIEPQSIEVSRAADLAYVRGRYQYTAAGKTDQGKYITVYRRTAGDAWKIEVDIFNSDQPAGKR